MYKHIVKYRYKTPEGNLSAVKDLEFELDKELDYDGPGAWRDICRNMIANKTHMPVQKPASLNVTSSLVSFLKMPRSINMTAITPTEKRRKNSVSLINI